MTLRWLDDWPTTPPEASVCGSCWTFTAFAAERCPSCGVEFAGSVTVTMERAVTSPKFNALLADLNDMGEKP